MILQVPKSPWLPGYGFHTPVQQYSEASTKTNFFSVYTL